MSFKVSCPGCSKALTSQADLTGKQVACPACKTAFVVPASRRGSKNIKVYLRRGESVQGPFAPQVVLEHLEKNAVSPLDFVGKTPEGPWQAVPSKYRDFLNATGWFYRKTGWLNDETIGPLSGRELVELYLKKKLTPENLICNGPEWTKLQATPVMKIVELERKVEQLAQARLLEEQQRMAAQQAAEQQRMAAQQAAEQQRMAAQQAAAQQAAAQDRMAAQTPYGEGVIEVHCQSGLVGAEVKISVLINGQLAGNLGVGQTQRYPAYPGTHQVEVRGGGSFGGATTTLNLPPNGMATLDLSYTKLGGLGLQQRSIATNSLATDAAVLAAGVAVVEAADAVDGMDLIDAAVQVADVASNVADVADVVGSIFDLFSD